MVFIKRYWWLLLVRGILLLIVAYIIIENPVQSLLNITFVLGCFFSLTGFFLLLAILLMPAFRKKLGRYLLVCCFDLSIGYIFIQYPEFSIDILPYIFALYITMASVYEILHAIELEQLGTKKWWVGIPLGGLGLLIGYFIMNNPMVGSMAIISFIGLGFALSGLINIYSALAPWLIKK